MKKILSIVSYPILPYFSGGQKSIAQFNEFLGTQAELTVISTNNNNHALAESYAMLPWMSSGKIKFFQLSLFPKITNYIKANGIQYIMLEHPYMGWLGWLIRWSCRIPLIIHTHNIEFLRFKSVGKPWWPILMWYERWVVNTADKVFCISEEDRQYMIDELGVNQAKCHVITFGLPYATIPSDKLACGKVIRAQYGIKESEAIILFNGLLNYFPNTNAVRDIIENINPILIEKGLSYKIIICGKGLPDEFNSLKDFEDKNIIYAGLVPDIELFFKAADIFINPVLSGGGIKTKLVEALGFNTTVISAETGAVGCDKEACGDKLVIIKDNDWNDFAEAIVLKLQEPIQTPDSFYAKYYWVNITKKALEALSQ